MLSKIFVICGDLNKLQSSTAVIMGSGLGLGFGSGRKNGPMLLLGYGPERKNGPNAPSSMLQETTKRGLFIKELFCLDVYLLTRPCGISYVCPQPSIQSATNNF